MFDVTGQVAIAQLAFFLVAVFIACYCLFKHGKQGLPGWVFICLFCVIRIIGSALIISDETGNKPVGKAALVVSSVAVAPLVLSVAGVAHESFNSIQCHGRFLFGWIPHLLVHVGCSGAIAIIVVGYLKLEGTDSTANVQKIGLDLIRGGGTILLIVWLGMSANMIVSYRYPRDLRGEKQLAVGASIALIALVIRILYTLLGSLINTTAFNPRTGGTTTEKVILNILPEFILTMTLLATGIMSRNLKDERNASALNRKNRAHNLDRSTTATTQA